MADPALQRPDMRFPQPTESKPLGGSGLVALPAASFLRGKTGETADRVFKGAMVLCGAAVLGTLVLIVYELVLRSGPSWHAFGLKFFGTSEWDPVSENLGRCRLFMGRWFRRFLRC